MLSSGIFQGIGFTVLGYYLMTATYSDACKVRLVAALLVLIGTLVTLGGTYLMTRRNGALFDGFYLHMSPSVIITGIGMFLLFRHVDFGRLGKRFRAVVMFFSRYSYGIYLAHVLVPWGLYDIGVYHSFINPALGIPLTAVICFAASAFLVWGINKVPLGKYISG